MKLQNKRRGHVYCKTCKHWDKTTNYGDSVPDDGYCAKIHEGITIEIDAGWSGGVVRSIETEETFGCVLHEEK